MKNAKMQKFKIFKDKKGINDMSILAIILSIFLLTSIIIPFINSEFDTEYAEYDLEGKIIQPVKDDSESASRINIFTILLTMLKLAIWDFGNSLDMPFWLQAIYSILGLIFILVISRNIWGGGGG